MEQFRRAFGYRTRPDGFGHLGQAKMPGKGSSLGTFPKRRARSRSELSGVVDGSTRMGMPVATAYGMFNERSQGYSLQMNQHAVSTEYGGYIFAFSISRTSLRIAGSCAVAAGVIIAVVANATEPFRGPLGIALGVLAITLLIAYTLNRSPRRQKLEPGPPTARTDGHQVMVGKLRRKKSLALELSLLTELHAKGALSDEEFSLAKRRLLGG